MLEKFFKSLNPMDMLNEWLISLGKDIVLSSYWVCLIVGLLGLILSIYGVKKGKNVAIISPVIYVLIKIFGGVILGI